MLFYAYHRDEYLTSDASLDAVLAFVLDVIDATVNEDAVLWCEGKVVAVVQSSGNVISFGTAALSRRHVQAVGA